MTAEAIDVQLHYCENDAIDESLFCTICSNLPNRSKKLPCCVAAICSLCAKKWLRFNSSCPFCRADIDQSAIAHGLPDNDAHEQVLREMLVVCPCSRIGCEWIGQRKFLYKHLKKRCNLFQGNHFWINIRGHYIKENQTGIIFAEQALEAISDP
jgi:hypothetical protein